MYLTGFADEAGSSLAEQIAATKELGWRWIESRNIDACNIHELSDEAFDQACAQLDEADIGINCFGSAVANWANSVADPFEKTMDTVRRCLPRMQRLGTCLIRIMSYRVEHEVAYDDASQNLPERIRRVAEIVRVFKDHGIQAVHENCMNYGGMGAAQSLRLLEAIPDLKLVFDTGNPVFTPDYAAGATPDKGPRQDSWAFYSQVRDHIAYVHIKDGNWSQGTSTYTWPGEGSGQVKRIVADLLERGYDGGISMEPHMGGVHHEGSQEANAALRRSIYVDYGQRFESLLESLSTA